MKDKIGCCGWLLVMPIALLGGDLVIIIMRGIVNFALPRGDDSELIRYNLVGLGVGLAIMAALVWVARLRETRDEEVRRDALESERASPLPSEQSDHE